MPDQTTPGKQPRPPRKTKADAPSKGINGAEAADAFAQGRASKAQIAVDLPRHKGHGVIDPRNPYADVPKYTYGQLPKVFENFVRDCIASWGGDPGAYACAFLSCTVGVLHASVRMNTNPDKPSVLRNPNDHALVLGKSGDNKSGLLRDLMRRQEKWHADAAKHRQATQAPKRAKGDMGPRVLLQRASVEGAFAQITDNKGERLIMTTEEAMGLIKGAGAHRGDGAADAVNDLITSSYDGGVYAKRLVGKVWDIPECLATLTAVGIFDEMIGWEGFDQFIRSGAGARTTVALMAHIEERDRSKCIEGAEVVMHDMLDKLHALRHIHFRMSDEAAQRWFTFTANKAAAIAQMEEDDEHEGLVAWAKKYDMRIMSMAVAFQAIEFIQGGQVDCTECASAQDGAVIVRTVTISEGNLVAAARFVERYLQKMQRVFYERASGMTEFHKELLNFMAYRIATDDPDVPERRVIPRGDLADNGPRRLRGGVTEQLKERRNRWIQALLDHGFIDVHDHPQARKLSKPRRDCEERWFRMRDEFYECFADDPALAWARDWYAKSRRGNALGESGQASEGGVEI